MRKTMTTLAATAALGGCMTMPPEPTSACPATTRNWNAFVNAMPGPGARPALIVTGEVEVPRRGLAPELIVGPTDRKFPPGQRFALRLARQAGAPAGWRPVRAEIRPSLADYGEVIVGCEGQTIVRISPVEKAY